MTSATTQAKDEQTGMKQSKKNFKVKLLHEQMLNKYVAGMSLPDLHHLAILRTDILEY